jgi:hypothetical protein
MQRQRKVSSNDRYDDTHHQTVADYRAAPSQLPSGWHVAHSGDANGKTVRA